MQIPPPSSQTPIIDTNTTLRVPPSRPINTKSHPPTNIPHVSNLNFRRLGLCLSCPFQPPSFMSTLASRPSTHPSSTPTRPSSLLHGPPISTVGSPSKQAASPTSHYMNRILTTTHSHVPSHTKPSPPTSIPSPLRTGQDVHVPPYPHGKFSKGWLEMCRFACCQILFSPRTSASTRAQPIAERGCTLAKG
ncbi:hypothetical protein ONZ45_g13232 [Pleurotus djamor]|nr:hypothetical protein ONZ45_g13232 [Pleurotus djamor]